MQMAVVNTKLPDSDPVKRDYANLLASLRQVAEESRNAVRGLRKLTARPETLADALLRIPQDLATIPEPVCEFTSRANHARSSRTCTRRYI